MKTFMWVPVLLVVATVAHAQETTPFDPIPMPAPQANTANVANPANDGCVLVGCPPAGATNGSATPTAKQPLKIDYTADAGVAARTTTGASVAVGGSVSVTKGDPTAGALTYTGTVSGLLGSTANGSVTIPGAVTGFGPSGAPIMGPGSKINTGPGILPQGEVGFSVSGRADRGGVLGTVSDAVEHVLDPSGKQNLQATWTAGIGADRDLMVNRTFRAQADAGLTFTHGDVNHGNSWSLSPNVATGVGVIGTQALPFIVLGAKGQYTYCPVQSKSGSDELCLVGSGGASAGVFQAELDANGTAEWRHKIADDSSNKWVHQITVGLSGGGEVDANLAGFQAGAQSGLAIGIR